MKEVWGFDIRFDSKEEYVKFCKQKAQIKTIYIWRKIPTKYNNKGEETEWLQNDSGEYVLELRCSI